MLGIGIRTQGDALGWYISGLRPLRQRQILRMRNLSS